MCLEVFFLILKLKSNSFLLVFISVWCIQVPGTLEIIFILLCALFNSTIFILFKSFESEICHYINTKKSSTQD